MLQIGDPIVYRPSFGSGAPTVARVVCMELTQCAREKQGTDVKEVRWEFVDQNLVVLSLDNGYWTYSDQVLVEKSLRAKELEAMDPKELPLYIGEDTALDGFIAHLLQRSAV